MFRTCLIGLALGECACPALAYHIAWEGDCLPEEAGWTRVWGDWSGQYHGTGAVRTLADGVMTMDSLYDDGVYDYAVIHRQLNPAPGELLVLEWRLAVDQVVGPGDPEVALFSDDCWAVGFKYYEGALRGCSDPTLSVPISMGEFHDYRVTSWDLRTYYLFIDGSFVHEGPFWHQLVASQMAWGDSTQGAANVARWDYVRVRTIPEPGCIGLLLVVAACCAQRRHAL